MKKLIIIIALAVALCGGCKPKDVVTIRIPGTSEQVLFRLIPAGSFMMGSPLLETDREIDEGPQHQVTISKQFYIGVYEVTQAQWLAVMGDNPSSFVASGNPVENVSWNDCQAFITKLNAMDIGLFRLPTEAEWEYACRANSSTRYYFGDDLLYNDIGDYAWNKDNSLSTTHPVGQKGANAWGLYDMHGNVWEYCSDWYGDYEDAAQIDPTGPSTGSYRVSRGGSWYYNPRYCRAASRSNSTPIDYEDYIGFRIVMMAP